MGVGPHDAVKLDRVTVLVGVEPPVAIRETREQAVLDAGVEGLPPHDQPGSLGPVGERDQFGEFDHRCSFTVLTVLFDGLVPELFESQGVEDGTVYLAIRAAHHGEPDVPLSTGSYEVFGAARGVGTDDDGALDLSLIHISEPTRPY